jgi:hypothetical protein
VVGLKASVLFSLVSLAILPTLTMDVVAQAIHSSVFVKQNRVALAGPFGHGIFVALLASLEGEELRLECGGWLVMLVLGILRVAGTPQGREVSSRSNPLACWRTGA